MDGWGRVGWAAGLAGAAFLVAGACSGSDGDVNGLTGEDGGSEQVVEVPLPDGGFQPPPEGTIGDEDPPPDAGPSEEPPPPTLDTGKPHATFTEVDAAPGGWTFLGQAEGAPSDVYGVSEDEGGNLWVAGGTEGLFLLRKGATRFERFGMEHGLQPYGLWKGKVPVGEKVLDVRAVTGGPPGVVWVGYEGLPNCESEFYKDPGQPEDPNVFKSGDADRVELQPDGQLKVFHYDLHSPAHTVPGYGHREKICSIHRIIWDKPRNSLWFGGNHGFSWGEANYQGGATCSDPAVLAANEWVHMPPDGGTSEVRQRCTNGVMEHMHPTIWSETASPYELTGNALGIAVKPDGDVWVGTAIRTTLFRIMTAGRSRWMSDPYDQKAAASGALPWNFEAARRLSADRNKWRNRIDVWPDLDAEPRKEPGDSQPNGLFSPEERRDDEVTGLVVMSDGTVWISSWHWGLAQLKETVNSNVVTVERRLFEGTSDAHILSLGRDTYDESLWLGHEGGGGLSRLQADKLIRFDRVLGDFGSSTVGNVQFVSSGEQRKVLVGFRKTGGRVGGVGIYTGR